MQLSLLGRSQTVSSASAENPLVPGLHLISEFISPAQESRLIQLVDLDYASEWRPDLVRRVQHYGYRYDYKARRADASMRIGPLPEFLEDIAVKLVQKDWFQQCPDQAIINEYLPGQGISAHIDCVPCFGPIVASLSLGADCVMDFRRKADGALQSVLLERRGLLVLTNDARYRWTHAIPARLTDKLNGIVIERARRISITFRSVIIDRTGRRTGGQVRPRPGDAHKTLTLPDEVKQLLDAATKSAAPKRR